MRELQSMQVLERRFVVQPFGSVSQEYCVVVFRANWVNQEWAAPIKIYIQASRREQHVFSSTKEYSRNNINKYMKRNGSLLNNFSHIIK